MTAAPILVLVRGLPGSGKSTAARAIVDALLGYTQEEGHAVRIEADMYFMVSHVRDRYLGEFDPEYDDDRHDDWGYMFDAKRLPDAHEWCQDLVESYLNNRRVVVVANTFAQRWEMEPYLALARKYGAAVRVVDRYDANLPDHALSARNGHGVPAERIAEMRANWEHDWRAGDPRPPWERDL